MEKLISVLNELGYTILFLIDEPSQIFIVNEFIPSKEFGKEELGFNTIIGIEITSRMSSLSPTESKPALRQKLEKIVEDMPVLKMRFSNAIKWIEYARH